MKGSASSHRPYRSSLFSVLDCDCIISMLGSLITVYICKVLKLIRINIKYGREENMITCSR